MQSPRSWILVCVVACSVLLAHPRAWAFIQKLFPLQEFIDDSDYIFTATVEKVDADKPSTVLVLGEHLKGEAPFKRIPINLTGDKQKHTPQLLKRIAADVPLVVGIKKQPDGKFMMLAYTNGTWFQTLGQTDGDQTRWAFTHCEIYLRRTFHGTTAELKQTIADVLASKTKSPPPNPKEAPGFGPVLETTAKHKDAK
ncbi:MAG: hypothetical protein H7062_09630 [Candidatus Saccharimonas sp.]|nr:hypothetical protein [Planctomycetaceae bacterium]